MMQEVMKSYDIACFCLHSEKGSRLPFLPERISEYKIEGFTCMAVC